jgi:hypothetical protein
MTGENPALAFDIEYALGPDGRPNYDEPLERRTVTWAEWVSLPVRPFDVVIETARGWLRAPTVIMAPAYADMPHARPRLSPQGVYERDGWRCQYTGKRLRPEEANIDHVIPKDRGGGDTWENLVTCTRSINSWKGNRLNSECGLKLIRRPRAPLGLPRCSLIRTPKHPDWLLFLTCPQPSRKDAAA